MVSLVVVFVCLRKKYWSPGTSPKTGTLREGTKWLFDVIQVLVENVHWVSTDLILEVSRNVTSFDFSDSTFDV